jgi:hypothetical protein
MGEIKKQTQTVKISADGIYRGVSVHTPYPLEESDYLKLTKVTSFVPIWAHTFFTGTAVFVLTVLAKWIDNQYFGGKNNISNTEFITLLILAILAIAFEILHYCVPSDKKKTIKKIDHHFQENKPKAAGFDNE